MKRALFISCLIFLYALANANVTNDSIKVTGDSLHYLTLKDSVYLEFAAYQEKVFYHYMAPKQTLYSLANFYGLNIDEIYYYNPEVKGNNISVGTKIKIPIPNKSIIRFKNENFDANKHVPIFYKVKKGDTIFNLAKRVFKMPIDTVMVRNNLSSFTLSLDQILQLGWMSVDGIPESNRRFRGHPIWKKNETMRRKYNQHREIKKEYTQRGVAFWQKQNGTQESKLYALHRNAPINSVIAVTNPMKKRTVYVKVIGRMPNSVYNDNVKVVVSSTAARMLGAKDAKFYVQIRYTK